MTRVNEDLRPCPFCGSDEWVDTYYHVKSKGWRVKCKCTIDAYETEAEAAKVWNYRPVEDALHWVTLERDTLFELFEACRGHTDPVIRRAVDRYLNAMATDIMGSNNPVSQTREEETKGSGT